MVFLVKKWLFYERFFLNLRICCKVFLRYFDDKFFRVRKKELYVTTMRTVGIFCVFMVLKILFTKNGIYVICVCTVQSLYIV